jgi:uncharacterized glyoxalase superfamily protein PhnB
MFSLSNSFNVLYSRDIEKTINFFEKLSVTIKEKAADKVVVGFGSFDLHYILNTSEPFEEYKYIAAPEHYGQGVIFYIETSDIKQVMEKIPEAGGTLKSSIFDNKWGSKELLTEDPNGYKFAFYQS